MSNNERFKELIEAGRKIESVGEAYNVWLYDVKREALIKGDADLITNTLQALNFSGFEFRFVTDKNLVLGRLGHLAQLDD